MQRSDNKDYTSTPGSPTDDRDVGGQFIEEVASSYAIQEYEERLRDENQLTLAYYFDSADVINMLQGGWAYESSTKFDEEALRRDREKVLVYALAFEGLLGTIHLLDPHFLELMKKLEQSDFFLKSPSREEYKDFATQVLHAHKPLVSSKVRPVSKRNVEAYVEELVEEGADLFRANYLLREFAWPRRLKYLKDDTKRLLLDNGRIPEISDLDLFVKIRKGFDVVRPARSENNNQDALALYFLQEKLTVHLQDARQPLPVFYGSSSFIRRAVKEIQKNDSALFTYPSQEGGPRIPIVRDALFFILEPVFKIGDKTEAFFQELQDAKGGIRALVRREYERYRNRNFALVSEMDKARKEFEHSIREIINVKFNQEIWIKHQFHKNMVDDLKQSLHWQQEEETSLIEQELRKGLEEALRSAQQALQRSIEWSAIVRHFDDLKTDVETYLPKSAAKLDVFRDFALIRFGLDKQKLTRIQGITEAMIVRLDDRLPDAEIISLLMTKPETEDKTERLLLGLSIAWLLEKYKLIVTLCDQFTNQDMQRRYEIALLLGASTISLNKNTQGIERTQEIINCILDKKDNYRVWLGIAFLYYRMWEVSSKQAGDLPEMDPEKWNILQDSEGYNKYIIKGSIHFVQKAYDYLENRLQEEKEGGYRLLSYVYALNNIIYYVTKSADADAFKNLEPLLAKLRSYEGDSLVWQGRFYDTLGWYFLRKALYSEDGSDLFKGYIKMANNFYELADSHIASPRDRLLYRLLLEGIQKVRERSKNNN
ncbi:MAG: hypothetical protein SH848_19380 [Saprospiraceae bacterium]|nr:hypothetical protein [Saprospiraceae bacterium]